MNSGCILTEEIGFYLSNQITLNRCFQGFLTTAVGHFKLRVSLLYTYFANLGSGVFQGFFFVWLVGCFKISWQSPQKKTHRVFW